MQGLQTPLNGSVLHLDSQLFSHDYILFYLWVNLQLHGPEINILAHHAAESLSLAGHTVEVSISHHRRVFILFFNQKKKKKEKYCQFFMFDLSCKAETKKEKK